MQEDIILYETAKLAKEKGYMNADCASYWKGELTNMTPWVDDFETYNKYERYHAPTQSLLQKWLRDVHGIDLWFGMLNEPNKYHVEDIIKNNEIIGGVNYGSETYEEALEIGLQLALELI